MAHPAVRAPARLPSHPAASARSATTTPGRTQSQQADPAPTRLDHTSVTAAPSTPRRAMSEQTGSASVRLDSTPATRTSSTTRRTSSRHATSARAHQPIVIPDSPEDELRTATLPVSHILNNHNNVVVNARNHSALLMVHSLGIVADTYVDNVGYPVDFVEELYSVRARYDGNFDGYQASAFRHFGFSHNEMLWFWENIEYPAHPKYRPRTVAVEVRLAE